MGRISRRYLNKDLEERIHSIFWEHLAGLQSVSFVKEFFQSLLSYTEQVMIAKRLAIAMLLSRGYTYEQIDQTLKVSKATIATVHRQILTGAPGYTRAIQLINRRKSHEEFWDSLEELLLKLSLPSRLGSAKYRLKSQIGKGLYKRKYQRDTL